jgi:predicted ArsR family transcriptional regulator
MQKTRVSILAYLKDHHSVSAGDLARVLEMTPANIRYHLDILRESGLIQVTGTRSAGGSGRPIILYNISSPSLGENLETLLRAFLEIIEIQSDPDSFRKDLVEHIWANRFSENLSDIQRFNLAVDFLSELNYHASWQARPDGPQVELRHCPYRALAIDNHKICQIDEVLISVMVNRPMRLVQKRTFADNPYSPCIFAAGKDPTSAS